MAEFKEVMKQAKRMCKEFGNDCAGCGLADSHCPLGPIPENMDADFANVERIVMDWADKNHEPRYPSWEATWKQLFPKVLYVPCPRMFLPNDRVEYYCGLGCGECRKSPIPADIAEKLGIKPIGGKDDARDSVQGEEN